MDLVQFCVYLEDGAPLFPSFLYFVRTAHILATISQQYTISMVPKVFCGQNNSQQAGTCITQVERRPHGRIAPLRAAGLTLGGGDEHGENGAEHADAGPAKRFSNPPAAAAAAAAVKQQPHSPLTSSMTAFAPASLIGGTALLYSAVLQHPSSTLTPLSVLYMVLLALQYTVQPRLSKRYIHADLSKQKVAFAEESVKTVLAATAFVASPTSSWAREWSRWTWQSSLAVAGLPAVLYAVQGVLQYVSYQHLDSVTFNGLSQTKTLTAAVFCYLLLGKRQSPLQILALLLLFVSTLIFQGHTSSTVWSSKKPTTKTTTMTTSQQQQQETDENNKTTTACLSWASCRAWRPLV